MKKIIIAFVFLLPVCSQAQLTDSSKRLLPVKGALNFRDVGGYSTTDGRTVNWGKIYRSASVNKLTDEDVALLDQKKIYTVIDFRGKEEAAQAPDRLPQNATYTLCPAGSDSLPDMARMVALIKQGGFLETMYGTEGLQYFGDRYRSLFVQLLTLDSDEALMYHCTGGRDRTGMATALLLYTLGVPQATIEADFVASNTYLKPMMGQMLQPLSKATGMTEEEISKEMDLRPELIRIFFAAIKEHYGSIELFMQQEMGVGEKERNLLKQKYTSAG